MEPSVAKTRQIVSLEGESGFWITFYMCGYLPRAEWLKDGEYMIGRKESACDIVILHDSQISRCHCTLRVERGVVIIADNKSTNGTWVNGHKISMCSVELKAGVNIVIGDTVLNLSAAQ